MSKAKKAAAKSKPKRKSRPKKAVKARESKPLDEQPLCVECHRWVAVCRGLCRTCYNQWYRRAA
jgi:hypothetical protein